MEVLDRVAGEKIRGEGELVDPRQHDVLGGLRDKYSQHRQDTRHPQLDCSY